MGRVCVFLGLCLLAHLSGFLDGTSACEASPHVHKAVNTGGSVNISIPNATYTSETSFFVQKYNPSSLLWEDVIYSSDEGSRPLLSSFKEMFSFSGGYFEMENVSKGAEGAYRIRGDMYKKCVAVVNLTVLEPSSFPPTVSGTTGAKEEFYNETKGKEPGSWNPLLFGVVLGVVAAVAGVLILVLWCKYGFWKARDKVSAYLRHVFSPLLPRQSLNLPASQQPGSPQDSQEYELTVVRDQTQGTTNRNGDPAPENGEEDLLMEAGRFTRKPEKGIR